MDSRLIYKTSEALQRKIDWKKLGETEWLYCGAAGEVKWDVVAKEIDCFFYDTTFYVATTRNDSFEASRESLLSSITNLVGSKHFFVWDKSFRKVVEFNKIGVYRKGASDANTNNPTFKFKYNKLSPGSLDKVKGKLVKYRKGDCLSLACDNGKYLAVFISEKFNKYYDFTLIEFVEERMPTPKDFVNGRFFGNYGETMERVFPAIEKPMLPCLEIDANPCIEKVGSLKLVEPLPHASYGYRKDIADVLQHYNEDLPLRIQRTINHEKCPDKIFHGARLIETRQILNMPEPHLQASQNKDENSAD